jgi:hypothetical protein
MAKKCGSSIPQEPGPDCPLAPGSSYKTEPTEEKLWCEPAARYKRKGLLWPRLRRTMVMSKEGGGEVVEA